MNGMEVFHFATQTVCKQVQALCRHTNVDFENIDYFIFHQANALTNKYTQKELSLPTQKCPLSLHDWGNTSSASIPITLISACHKIVAKKTLTFLFCGFGAGTSWGSCLITCKPFVCVPA